MTGNDKVWPDLLVELDSFNVVKHIQQMGLDGVGVRCLAQNLQQSRVRHEEESRKAQPFLLQVSEGGEGYANELTFMKMTSPGCEKVGRSCSHLLFPPSCFDVVLL